MSIKNLFWLKNMSNIANGAVPFDVTFILTNQKADHVERISAHKLVLAATSPVFKAMFYGELKEDGDIRITDVSAEGFKDFLQLFYKEQVELDVINNIADVLKLIDKYDVPDCYKSVEKLMEEAVSVSNVCFLHELATLYQLSSKLFKTFASLIEDQPKQVFQSSMFASIGKIDLQKILQLNMKCDEKVVFDATVNWAKNRLNGRGLFVSDGSIKEELGETIKLIRFPTMKHQHFVDALEQYPNLLEPNVYLDILSYIGSQRPLTVAADYSIHPRHLPPTYEEQLADSFDPDFSNEYLPEIVQSVF